MLFNITVGCSSKHYKIKKESKKIPAWYMVEKTKKGKIYSKASAVSPSLELATLKALNLALSDIAIRVQGNIDSSRVQELSEGLSSNNTKKNYVNNDSINNQINTKVTNFKIPEYKIIDKEAFLDQNNNYKVYIMLQFNKENI